jgi:hypothetical protein
MTNQRPIVPQPRYPESYSTSCGFRLLASAIYFLPFAFYLLPSASLAQTNHPSKLPSQSVNPPRIDPSARNNISPNPKPSDNKDSNLSTPKNVPLNIILPEGYPINGRQAKLVKDSIYNRWFLVFNEALLLYAPELAHKNAPKSEKDLEPENNPFCHPIEVLPGKWLTAMINPIGDQTDQSIDFRVWGEVTAYQGLLNSYRNRNYILPAYVATLSPFGKDAAEKAKTPKKINPLEAAFGQPKSAEPEIAKQTQILDKAKIPNKLRDALASIPRTRPLELPDLKQSHTRPKPTIAIPDKTDDKKTSKPNDWRDGYMIIDRVGRIHFDPEGLQWLFTFEADGGSLLEPPLTLHPCRLLEIMENAVERSSESLRFRISGQISQYQGRNYLLLRKVLMVYDLGNLVK